MDRSHPPETMMIITAQAHTATCTFCTRMLVRFRGVRNLSVMMLKKMISTSSRIGMDRFPRISPTLIFFFAFTGILLYSGSAGQYRLLREFFLAQFSGQTALVQHDDAFGHAQQLVHIR